MSSPRLQPLISAIGQVLLGKEQAVRLALFTETKPGVVVVMRDGGTGSGGAG